MKIKTRMLENERERTYRILLEKVIDENVIPFHHIPTKKDIVDNETDFLLKYEYYFQPYQKLSCFYSKIYS